MPHINRLREFLVDFNNTFPLDKEYRKKYNIPFNSTSHRQVCQIDVYMEWLENELYREYEHEIKNAVERKEKYDNGEWLSANETAAKSENKAFDSIDINNL